MADLTSTAAGAGRAERARTTAELRRDSSDVLVVAGEPILRRGLCDVLGESFEVRAATGTVATALRLLRQISPSTVVTVIDPAPPDAATDQACAALAAAGCAPRLVALTRGDDGTSVRRSYALGMHAVLPLDVDGNELVDAVQRVNAGEIVLHPGLTRHFLRSCLDASFEHADGRLTGAQVGALRLVSLGYTGKEIAALMQKTVSAVNHDVERATQRLGAVHRSHATAQAVRLGLFT